MNKKVVFGVAAVIVIASVILTSLNDESNKKNEDNKPSQTDIVEQKFDNKNKNDDEGDTDSNKDTVADNSSVNESDGTGNVQSDKTGNGNEVYDSDKDIPEDTLEETTKQPESDVIENIDIPDEGEVDKPDNNKDGESEGIDKDIKDEPSQTTKKPDRNNNEEIVPESVKKTEYKVSSMTLKKGENVSIEYPVIVDWDNTEEDKWNKLFKDRASRIYNLLDNDDNYSITMSIRTKNEKYLSIKLEGNSYINDTQYGVDICYTYNIDMSTGENASLAKNYDVEKIAKKIVAGECVVNPDREKSTCTLGDIAQFNSSSNNSLEQNLISKLKNYDSIQVDGNSDPHTGYSYIEDNNVYLVMEVPHDCGDYAVVKINN